MRSAPKKTKPLTDREVLKRLNSKVPELSPAEALEYALDRPNVSVAIRYNIGCSQAVLEFYKEAAKTLTDALKQAPAKQGTQLAAQAKKDPSLKDLLEHDDGKTLKEELEEWAKEPATESPTPAPPAAAEPAPPAATPPAKTAEEPKDSEK